jgi:hypothetical protein
MSHYSSGCNICAALCGIVSCVLLVIGLILYSSYPITAITLVCIGAVFTVFYGIELVTTGCCGKCMNTYICDCINMSDAVLGNACITPDVVE